jgi:hypothetical protein
MLPPKEGTHMARKGSFLKSLFKAPKVKSYKPRSTMKRRDFYDPAKHGLKAVLFGRPKRKK